MQSRAFEVLELHYGCLFHQIVAQQRADWGSTVSALSVLITVGFVAIYIRFNKQPRFNSCAWQRKNVFAPRLYFEFLPLLKTTVAYHSRGHVNVMGQLQVDDSDSFR